MADPRWLRLWRIAWLHQHEGADPQPDPPEALARWRAEPGGREARADARARARLGAPAARLEAVAERSRWLLLALAVLVLLAGAAGGFALLGDGSRAVNVVWAWMALLGPHLAMLVLWLFGLAAGSGPSALGRALLWLGRRWPRLLPEPAAARALGGLVGSAAVARWGLSLLSHLLWLAALAGALIGLLLALSLRRYGFVWETTILPEGWFERGVMALAWLPAQLGLPQPGPDLIRASGEAAVSDPAGRQAWSFWLVGSLLSYGLLPRLIAALVCLVLLRRSLDRLRLPWEQPYYTRLQDRLAADSERSGIVDPDPGRERDAPWRSAAAGQGRAALALDLPPDWPWALPTGVEDLGRCETREQRRRVLERLSARPPARLLVAVEAAQSPDRGTLRWLGEMAARSQALAVWLAGPDRDGRRALWCELLQRCGLPRERIHEDAAAAMRWLQEEAQA
ncbi:MAG: hypothetical protein KatS3mg126_0649 [Lysobacteraceae bacterium]|nr:MAG: hypothetical protein KatS3mg126_0649 [Xanthomonadaceae bacterium]